MRNKIAEIGGKSARNRGFKTPHADANSRQDVYYILGNVLHGRLIRSGHLWGSNIFSNHIKVKSILECSRKPHSFLFKGDWNKKCGKCFTSSKQAILDLRTFSRFPYIKNCLFGRCKTFSAFFCFNLLWKEKNEVSLNIPKLIWLLYGC